MEGWERNLGEFGGVVGVDGRHQLLHPTIDLGVPLPPVLPKGLHEGQLARTTDDEHLGIQQVPGGLVWCQFSGDTSMMFQCNTCVARMMTDGSSLYTCS